MQQQYILQPTPIQQGTYVISKNDIKKLNNPPPSKTSNKVDIVTESKKDNFDDLTVKEVAVNDVTNEVLDDCEEIKLSDDVKVSTSNQAKAKVDVWTEESKKTGEQKFVCIFSEIFTYS